MTITSSARRFRTGPVAAVLAAGLLLAAGAGDALAQRTHSGSATVTGPRGGTTTCDRTATNSQSGRESSTNCTGPGGRQFGTSGSTTRNGDGTVSGQRTFTGPGGRSTTVNGSAGVSK